MKETNLIETDGQIAENGQTNLGNTYFNGGLKYYHGDGVEKDYIEAVEWFRRSIEQGHVGGYFYLGVMYYHGYGYEKNDQEAFQYFWKAIEKEDNVTAKLNIGAMYANGAGVEKNYKESIKWFKTAIDLGELSAKKTLHKVYSKGIKENDSNVRESIENDISRLTANIENQDSEKLLEAGFLCEMLVKHLENPDLFMKIDVNSSMIPFSHNAMIISQYEEAKKWYSMALNLGGISDKEKSIRYNINNLERKIKIMKENDEISNAYFYNTELKRNERRRAKLLNEKRSPK